MREETIQDRLNQAITELTQVADVNEAGNLACPNCGCDQICVSHGAPGYECSDCGRLLLDPNETGLSPAMQASRRAGLAVRELMQVAQDLQYDAVALATADPPEEALARCRQVVRIGHRLEIILGAKRER
jgi:predicted RNA-binding Zn-ribbon protein involved in translation (DUF1610 family)